MESIIIVLINLSGVKVFNMICTQLALGSIEDGFINIEVIFISFF